MNQEMKVKKYNYDFNPVTKLELDFSIDVTTDNVFNVIANEVLKIKSDKKIVVMDTYLSIDTELMKKTFSKYKFFDLIVDLNEFKLSDENIELKFNTFLTNHPVNGKYFVGQILDFYKVESMVEIENLINNKEKILIIGWGATSLIKGNINIYVSTTFENAMNRMLDNNNYLTEKRLTYLDFHASELHRREILHDMDYIIDASADELSITSIVNYKNIISKITKLPFRTVPIFQENIWGGGKWFQYALGAPKTEKKYSFLISAILEQQHVLVENNGAYFHVNGQDLMTINPVSMLGEKNFYTYGYRCPIHLLLVDTIGGENSSLQVHPTAGYNQDYMNYPFGHHEGYYMVETTEESGVYLGVKEGLKIGDFLRILKDAPYKEGFDAKTVVDYYPVEKFDYIYLPGGVVHAFCKETVCLEIDSTSTTTFKLWDWGRLDANGKPRHIDLELAEKVIQEKFNGSWSKENLFYRENNFRKEYENQDLNIGTMEYCPMNVNKHWFKDKLFFATTDQMQIVVLVEGESAVIFSPDGLFPDYEIHYMEAIYIPRDLEKFGIKGLGDKHLAIIRIEKEI